ncbi:MAG: erythromycin biosynthesis sensory transduction protein eryC1 [Rhodospirillales bacterium RIFCSPLOWO2_12_FULL_67_15]|nr:MAG: erythromycin biosynthesis sensory transduction protein eryC1 [Rhodospirillales bacterium RIFCSPLOWO2_12_FULL_67_15]
MVPFVDLKAQYHSLKAEIDRAMTEVIESSSFIRGPALAAFEREFAAAVGARHAIGVASGTDALNLALRALDLGPGDEAITVPNTWISTAFAVSHAGARLAFVDIDPATGQMDADDLGRALTPRTKAVLPVHMFGHPAPMDRIMAICRPRGIRVVEDIAQAPLAEVHGKKVGSFGDLACYSFYPSKNLGCYGDGGAVTSDDDVLAERVWCLADYGQKERFRHAMAGWNSRLDTLQAAILRAKLPHLVRWTETRRARAKRYGELLAGLPVRLPREAPWAKAVYHLYVVEVDRRDECLAFLRAQGVMAQVHYPACVHLQPCYAELGYRPGDFPAAEAAKDRILSLPMYPELTEAQMRTVADALAAFLRRG